MIIPSFSPPAKISRLIPGAIRMIVCGVLSAGTVRVISVVPAAFLPMICVGGGRECCCSYDYAIDRNWQMNQDSGATEL
jgi:hypothetical protein